MLRFPACRAHRQQPPERRGGGWAARKSLKCLNRDFDAFCRNEVADCAQQGDFRAESESRRTAARTSGSGWNCNKSVPRGIRKTLWAGTRFCARK